MVYYVLFGLTLLDKPLSTDEVEFSMASVELAKTGKPLFYMGEVWGATMEKSKSWWAFQDSGKPWHLYGFWHPPGLLHIISNLYKIFGIKDWVARFPGFICGIGSLLLLRRCARLLAGPENAGRAEALVSILYGVNPFLLQLGVMVDLDNTVVNFCSIWYLYEFARSTIRKVPLWRKHLGLAGILVCGFWAKEFTGVYLMVACGFYLLVRRDWKELGFALLGFALGSGVFLASWWLYCKLGHYDPWYWYHFTIKDKLVAGTGLLRTALRDGGIHEGLRIVRFTSFSLMIWVGPVLFPLFLWGLFDSCRALVKSKRPSLGDLFCVFGAAMIGITVIYRPSLQMLKYTYPIFGPSIAFIGIWLARKLGSLAERELLAVLLAAGAVALSQRFIFGDMVFFLYNAPLLESADVGFWYCAASLSVLLAIRFLADSRSRARLLLLSLLALCTGMNLGTSLGQLGKEYVTSVSWNNYGDSELDKAIEYAKANIKPNEMVICRKEFGFYLRLNDPKFSQRWYIPPMVMEADNSQQLVENLSAPGLNWLILDRYLLREDAVPFLQNYFQIVKTFGAAGIRPSFYFLKRRADVPPAPPLL
jgi:4-amino-4-deoxy-L-arabinose transferase-like glycosyltransferase